MKTLSSSRYVLAGAVIAMLAGCGGGGSGITGTSTVPPVAHPTARIDFIRHFTTRATDSRLSCLAASRGFTSLPAAVWAPARSRAAAGRRPRVRHYSGLAGTSSFTCSLAAPGRDRPPALTAAVTAARDPIAVLGIRRRGRVGRTAGRL